MWNVLWNDFEQRALRLLGGGPPLDAVDHTIDWQIRGTRPFVSAPIPSKDLQLPELYSGAPWSRGDAVGLADRWVAFVTVNPSIDPLEVFPTRANRTVHGPNLVRYFQERFEPGPIAAPLVHGRDGQRVAVWKDIARPGPSGQPTWHAIDRELNACLAAAGIGTRAPLGRVAAIIDVVPWKFAKWSSVPAATKVALRHAGAPYLAWTLATYRPAAIVAAGRDVRRVLHDLHPTTVPTYQANTVQRGTIATSGPEVPVFGIVAPTAHGNRFGAEMAHIADELRAALGVP